MIITNTTAYINAFEQQWLYASIEWDLLQMTNISFLNIFKLVISTSWVLVALRKDKKAIDNVRNREMKSENGFGLTTCFRLI